MAAQDEILTQVRERLMQVLPTQLIFTTCPEGMLGTAAYDERADKLNALPPDYLSRLLTDVREMMLSQKPYSTAALEQLAVDIGLDYLFSDEGWIDRTADYVWEHRLVCSQIIDYVTAQADAYVPPVGSPP